jgi:predicted RNase H-like HicB family nuclease
MEVTVKVHVEALPEGFYLATSPELPGLLAQGRTIKETLDIARDVARKLIDAREQREGHIELSQTADQQDSTIVVGT